MDSELDGSRKSKTFNYSRGITPDFGIPREANRRRSGKSSGDGKHRPPCEYKTQAGAGPRWRMGEPRSKRMSLVIHRQDL